MYWGNIKWCYHVIGAWYGVLYDVPRKYSSTVPSWPRTRGYIPPYSFERVRYATSEWQMPAATTFTTNSFDRSSRSRTGSMDSDAAPLIGGLATMAEKGLDGSNTGTSAILNVWLLVWWRQEEDIKITWYSFWYWETGSGRGWAYFLFVVKVNL